MSAAARSTAIIIALDAHPGCRVAAQPDRRVGDSVCSRVTGSQRSWAAGSLQPAGGGPLPAGRAASARLHLPGRGQQPYIPLRFPAAYDSFPFFFSRAKILNVGLWGRTFFERRGEHACP